MHKDPRLRDAIGSDGRIVSACQFESPRGMASRAEDVLDLSGFSQRVQKRRTGRGDGSAGSVARSTLSRIAGLLSRPVCRPCAVAKRLAPLGSIRELLRGVDRGVRAPIVGPRMFENRQCGPRAGRRKSGDFPEFGRAQ
jgi:hypothetical protein